MIPILLVCNNKKMIDKFIEGYLKKHSIVDYAVFLFEPTEKTGISIDQIRDVVSMSREQSTKSRLFIIKSLETAKVESQHALLKTLEETGNNHYILVVKDEYAILPTIRSRTFIKRLTSEVNIKKDSGLFENETIADQFQQYTLQTGSKDKVVNLLISVLAELQDKLYKQYANENVSRKLVILIKEIHTLLPLLEKNNINPQLTLDHLFIEYKKLNLLDNPDAKK